MPETNEIDGQDGAAGAESQTTGAPDAGQQSPEQSQQSAGAESAGAEKPEAGADKGSEDAAKAPKSALEAVRGVVNAGRDKAEAERKAGAEKPDADASKDGKPAADEAAPGDDEKAGILSKEEWSGLPPRVKARISKISANLRTEREAHAALRTQFEPTVQAYNGLMDWVDKAGLTQGEFSNALEFARLVRAEPARAYEMIQPVLQHLQAHVGEILPDDLRDAVEKGTVSEEHAKELAFARREKVRLEGTITARTEADTQAEERRAATEAINATTSAIASWEASWKASDPDYAKKKDQVWERMATLAQSEAARQRLPHARQLPGEVWIKLAAQARKDVDERIAGLLPRRQHKEPIVDGGSNANSRKVPQSGIEAVRFALSGRA